MPIIVLRKPPAPSFLGLVFELVCAGRMVDVVVVDRVDGRQVGSGGKSDDNHQTTSLRLPLGKQLQVGFTRRGEWLYYTAIRCGIEPNSRGYLMILGAVESER